MNWFYISLKYFTQQQREFLVSILTSIQSNFSSCDNEEQNMIVYLYSKLHEYNTNEKETVYDFTLKRLLFNCFALLYEVAKGESFRVKIDKTDDDDWSEYIIAVRDDVTGLPVSLLTEKAINAESQFVEINNYPLSENTLHKLRITLETDNGNGVASGNAVSTIGYVYLLTSKDIDVVNE